MSESSLQISCIVSQPFAENTFILNRIDASECLVIDPGFDPDAIFRLLADRRLRPAAILNTHGHSDHIAGNEALKQRFPEVPLIIGEGDAYKLTDPNANLSAPFGVELLSPPADQTVSEGETLEFAGIPLKVLETPGHSAGHVVFLYEGQTPPLVIGGDVLFREGIGRTDFPDGDHATLLRSIQQKLFCLPDETIVLPGHGPETTVGHEKQHNPFLRGL